MYTIQNKTVRKYDRKTKDYTRTVSLFDKYTVTDVHTAEQTNQQIITVQGPKQTFRLCQCFKNLVIVRPCQPAETLPLFYVMAGNRGMSVSEIQGAAFFALRGDVLIPYRSNGRGTVEPL